MERLVFPPRARIYLDANVIIYIVEGTPLFASAARVLVDLMEAGAVVAVTSELTLAEVLVRPLKIGNMEIVTKFKALFGSPELLDVIPVSRAILVRAAEIRAALGGRLPDAIHASTAVDANVTYLVTEDAGLRVPAPVSVTRFSDLAK